MLTFANQSQQVLAVAVLLDCVAEPLDLRRVDPALAEGDLLGAGDLEALAALDGLDELRRLEQRLVRAGVESRHAAAK